MKKNNKIFVFLLILIVSLSMTLNAFAYAVRLPYVTIIKSYYADGSWHEMSNNTTYITLNVTKEYHQVDQTIDITYDTIGLTLIQQVVIRRIWTAT